MTRAPLPGSVPRGKKRVGPPVGVAAASASGSVPSGCRTAPSATSGESVRHEAAPPARDRRSLADAPGSCLRRQELIAQDSESTVAEPAELCLGRVQRPAGLEEL